jgi:TolB-like protein/DNA-binding winged helix-turn-helix (wHTH) protein/Flp pilus assembly protein TadD
MIQLGRAVFDPDAHVLRDAAGARLPLRSQSLRVLECLVGANGEVVTKENLVQAVWGRVAVTDDSLVQCIGEIRVAIGDAAHEVLQTQHRRGYRLLVAAKRGLALSQVDAASVWVEPSSVQAEPVKAQAAARSGRQDFAAPAIAVMAFGSMAGDERSERLAMTFAGDLSAELARHRELRVISRLSSFALKGLILSTQEIGERLNARFIVSGQVQFSESAIDWSLEMVDGASDEIVWSERRQVHFSDIYAETAALIGRMAGMIDNSFRLNIIAKAQAKAPDSLNAYDLVSRAEALFILNSVEGARRGQALATLAVERHPNYGRAWRTLAHAHSFDMHSCHTGEWKDGRVGEALAEVRRSIELEATSPFAYAVLANLLSVAGQLDEALIASDRAMAFVEGDPIVLHLRSVVLLHAGRFEEALQNMLACRAIVPIPRATHLEILGRILLGIGDVEKATDALRQAVTLAPGSIARMSLVVALEESGQHELAARHFKTLLTHTNGFDEGYFGKRYGAIPQFRERYLKALRVHGIQSASTATEKDDKVSLILVKRA